MKPTTEIKIKFDERKRELTAITIYTDKDKDLKSTITNIYTGDKAVKRFLNHQKEQKLNAKKTIDSAKQMLQDLKDKEKELTKGKKSLTQAQKDLIEELRIVRKYQELDAVQQKKIMQEEQLVKIEEGFKEDKATYETIKHECKAIDFKFD